MYIFSNKIYIFFNVKFVWRAIVFFFSVSVKQITFSFNKCNSFTFCCISVVIFISKVCKKVRVLETVHDIVGCQVSDLIS